MSRTLSSLLRMPALAVSGGPLRAARLIACDLDGTLLDGDGMIGPTTATLIRRIRDLGLPFVFVTARHHDAVVPFSDQLRLDEPIISLDGALTMLPHERTPRRCAAIGAPLADRFLRVRRAHPGAGFIVVTPRGIHSTPVDTPPPTRYVHWNIERLPLEDAGGDIALELIATGTFDAVNAVYRDLESVISRNVDVDVYESYSRPGHWFLELRSTRATKRRAVDALIRSAGIPAREVIAIGDARNDIEFCKRAGYVVALRNAVDELKSIADVVTERSCVDHGIDEFLQHLLRVRAGVPVAHDEPCQS